MQVVDATPDHVEQFLRKPTRPDDVDEWFVASGGRRMPDLLAELKANPTPYFRALLNEKDECVCLWGASPVEGVGLVWLVASVEAERLGKALHRHWREEVATMHSLYGHLSAIAYGGNELHLKWLRTIGFKPISEVYVKPHAVPFINHARLAADV